MVIKNPVLPPPPRAQLCDKVPSFDSGIAMKMIQDELGRPWQEVHPAGSLCRASPLFIRLLCGLGAECVLHMWSARAGCEFCRSAVWLAAARVLHLERTFHLSKRVKGLPQRGILCGGSRCTQSCPQSLLRLRPWARCTRGGSKRERLSLSRCATSLFPLPRGRRGRHCCRICRGVPVWCADKVVHDFRGERLQSAPVLNSTHI